MIAEDGTQIAERGGTVQAISDDDDTESANRQTVVYGTEEKKS